MRLKLIWRVVRAGRRSTIGNRVNGQNRFEGSNPLLSAKIRTTPKGWFYIFGCFRDLTQLVKK